MATQLTPRTLDIEITKITARRVYYKLWAGKAETFWEIPEGSAFNTSNLLIGERYKVYSNVVVVSKRDFKTRKRASAYNVMIGLLQRELCRKLNWHREQRSNVWQPKR
jgi:hypothetical protein